MSYLWYTWVGFLTTILVGLVVSWFTGPNKYSCADKRLFTPIIHRFLRSKDPEKVVHTYLVVFEIRRNKFDSANIVYNSPFS